MLPSVAYGACQALSPRCAFSARIGFGRAAGFAFCARLPATARLEPPASGHPQVAPHDHPALEPEQEVLAHRVDRLEDPAVDAGRDAGGLAARMRRLDLEPLADERLEPPRRAMDCVPFGHQVQLRASVFPAWHRP